MTTKEYQSIQPKTRQAWRKWLEKNHDKQPGVWLIYFKKSTGKSKLNYNDSVEEALCFGWIDSTMRPVDEERFMQRFTPRKTKSGWSALNKKRIKKMMDERLMMEPGQNKINEAKKDGSWERLDHVFAPADQLKNPPDLEKALSSNKKAREHFDAFPVSARRQFLAWINDAKRDETRRARVKQTVLMAKANKKPGVGGFKL